MANALIAIGAIAALGGLAWLAYAGSILRGPKGNALLGGFSATVIGGAVIVLGASMSDEPGEVQQFINDNRVVTAATETPSPSPTATPERDPVEEYRTAARDVAARADSDLSRVIQLLRVPNSNSPLWLSDVRQTTSQFARYKSRAEELAPPPGWVDVQERLVAILGDLAAAGRKVADSLVAFEQGNLFVAETELSEALSTMNASANVLVDIADEFGT